MATGFERAVKGVFAALRGGTRRSAGELLGDDRLAGDGAREEEQANVARAEAAELDELPEELAARVRAATTHATHRTVRSTGDSFGVWALCDDRVVVMALSLREDGSVAEATEAFVAEAVAEITPGDGDGNAALLVDGPTGRRRVDVPVALAAAIRARQHGGTVPG